MENFDEIDDLITCLSINIFTCIKKIADEINFTFDKNLFDSIFQLRYVAEKSPEINIFFSNPVLNPLSSKIDSICSRITEESQHWPISIKSFRVQRFPVKNSTPTTLLSLSIDRKSLIDLIFSSPSKKVEKSGRILILDTNFGPRYTEWHRLRCEFTRETLNRLFTEKFHVINRSVEIEQSQVSTKFIEDVIEDFTDLNIHDGDVFRKCDLRFVLNAKLILLSVSIGNEIVDFEQFDKILILTSPLNSTSVRRALLLVLKSHKKDSLISRLISLEIGQVDANLTLNEFQENLVENIIKHQETLDGQQYPQYNIDILRDFGLRYTLLICRSDRMNQLNLSRYKEAFFIQYNYARLRNICQKFSAIKSIDNIKNGESHIGDREWYLWWNMLITEKLIREIITMKPPPIHQLLTYAFKMAQIISVYYNKNRVLTKVNEETLPTIEAKVKLVEKLMIVMGNCIQLIGGEGIDVM